MEKKNQEDNSKEEEDKDMAFILDNANSKNALNISINEKEDLEDLDDE